ncbi:MAG TPA: LytTR family DNA-binding domain-containing protein, partial [Candidatus Polarisedimenticolia bacterium]|nr:LytTR family DNA-binding domain-containing protein [Candidatus Polarisedimenticolia bacterium]
QRLRDDRRAEARRRTLALLESLRPDATPLNRLVIRSAGRVFLLRVEEIDWFEAEAQYVRVHAGKDSHLFRQAIGALEPRLDPKHFVRIHRSAIVNLDRVRMLEPSFHGDYRVVLRDGKRLTLSRSRRKKLASLLRSPL